MKPNFISPTDQTYHSHFFACILSICLCPLQFTRISLPFEISMTFTATKLKRFSIIPYKRHTMTRIDWRRTKVTRTNAHGNQGEMERE